MSSFSCWPALAPRVSLSFEFIYFFFFRGSLCLKKFDEFCCFRNKGGGWSFREYPPRTALDSPSIPGSARSFFFL
jgi:hypothetical protein